VLFDKLDTAKMGNHPDKLRHTRSVAYSVELVVLNKHQISGGGAYLDCYPEMHGLDTSNVSCGVET